DFAAGLAVTPGLTILIDAEQLTITAVNRTANTFTVIRGVNGTAAAAHDVGAGLFPATDQRGVLRSGGVNIGAYQASASALVLTAPATVTAGMPLHLTPEAADPFPQP